MDQYISLIALDASLYCIPHPHFPRALNHLWLGAASTHYSGKPPGLFRAVLSGYSIMNRPPNGGWSKAKTLISHLNIWLSASVSVLSSVQESRIISCIVTIWFHEVYFF